MDNKSTSYVIRDIVYRTPTANLRHWSEWDAMDSYMAPN